MTVQSQNNNLNFLVDSTFTNFNRLFVLSFARTNAANKRKSFSHYYLSKVEIKDFNALIDGKSFFDLPVKKMKKKLTKKIMDMSNNNDYTTGNLLDFAYFKEN